MRVAVVFFGVARGIRLTEGSIRTQLYDCNRSRGVSLHIIASLNLVERITNSRTGECDDPAGAADLALLAADVDLSARQDDTTIAEPLLAAQRQSDAFDNEWVSVRNVLHQLHSLWRVRTALGATLGAFDYVLFARADLRYLDPICVPELASRLRTPGSIAVPAWHGFGGFNDRLALADPIAARHYLERLQLVAAFCREQPLHPESLLAFALQRADCRVCELPVRAQRVRANGQIVDERFSVGRTKVRRRARRFVIKRGRVRFPHFRFWTR